ERVEGTDGGEDALQALGGESLAVALRDEGAHVVHVQRTPVAELLLLAEGLERQQVTGVVLPGVGREVALELGVGETLEPVGERVAHVGRSGRTAAVTSSLMRVRKAVPSVGLKRSASRLPTASRPRSPLSPSGTSAEEAMCSA